MAQKVMLIDDLDGSEGAETIMYSVDGKDYEVDLSENGSASVASSLRAFSITTCLSSVRIRDDASSRAAASTTRLSNSRISILK